MSIPHLPEPTADLLNFVGGGIDRIIDRAGEWMPTFTGRRFYPVDPQPEDVAVEDIAVGLARQPRFTGQTRWTSRVAPHSDLVSLLVPLSEALPGKFHDSGEAYIGDQTRPMKESLRKEGVEVFDRLEAGILRAVFQHFKIPTAHERGVPGAIQWSTSLKPEDKCRALVGKIVKCADNVATIIESVRLYGYQEVRTWKIGSQIDWAMEWHRQYLGPAEEQNHALLQVGYGIPAGLFRRIMRSEQISEEEAILAFELRYKDICYMMSKTPVAEKAA